MQSPTPPCSYEHFDQSTSTWKVCPKQATKGCEDCGLAFYCSVDCQLAHSRAHAKNCDIEQKEDGWYPRYRTFFEDIQAAYKLRNIPGLWPRFPQIDVLELKQNEGTNYNQDISILLASSPDLLQDMQLSIVNLPVDYNKCIEFTLVDDNELVTIRTLFMLLIAFKFEDPKKAVEAMIHLSYSVALPTNLWKDITDAILPSVENFYLSVKHKKLDIKVSNTWVFGSQKVHATMARKGWKRIMQILKPDVPLGLHQAMASRRSIVCDLAIKKLRGLKLWSAYPNCRIADIRFRQTGILLPFGYPVSSYTEPNLTLFNELGEYVGPALLTPRDCYKERDLFCKAVTSGRPLHDVYGEVYFDLTVKLGKFIEHIKKRNINFHLYSVEYEKLLGTLGCYRAFHINGLQFDRIYASNLADSERLGFEKTVRIFSPRLKSKNENPRAALLLMHTTALTNANAPRATHLGSYVAAFMAVRAYLGEEMTTYMLHADEETFQLGIQQLGPARHFRMEWLRLFYMDHNDLWGKYCKQENIMKLAADAGLVPKEKNTLVSQWRYRLSSENTGIDDLTNDRCWIPLLHSGLHGAETYSEWFKP